MKYKLTEDGKAIEMKDGKPVVIDGETEITIDALGANDKITAVTKESNERRKKLGEANTKLEAFGDLDPEVARKAMEDVTGMSDKGKADLEAQRDSINAAWKEKQTGWDNDKKVLTDKLFDATVGVNFATSKVVAGTVLPPDIAKATFGKHFNADGTANDAAGNTILSKQTGEPAGFEEAMTHLIDNYPQKDSILKPSGGSGSGGHGAGSGGDMGETKTAVSKITSGLKAL